MTTPSENWQPMHEQLQFSDYSEWLDEGTEALVRDIADRATAKQAVGEPVRASQYELEISHDGDLGVYRASISDDVVANLSYKVVGHRVVLLSTSVLPQFRNHGIATALIGHALDDIRGTGRTVTIICPAVREFMDHYPQYEDLLDKNRPGVRSQARAGGLSQPLGIGPFRGRTDDVPDSNEPVYTGVSRHIGRYADACVVPAGGRTIYVSGTPGLTEDGKVPELFGDEVRQMFVNIEAALAKAGATMSDVVSVRQWLTRADDLPEYVGLQKEFIKHEPAAMLSFIDGFVWPEIHVEVEVVAVVH